MDLTGKNAMVTGGGVRVGRAIALELASHGADVYVHYGTSAGPADEVVAEIETMGRRAVSGSADLRNPGIAADLVADASKRLGPVSLLVNNASGFPEDRLTDVTLDQWRSTLDLTLASPVFLTQAFALALPQHMMGAIVNVTDVKTMTPYLEHFSYMIAKGGLDTFTRAAARALAPRIRVNAVALGAILPPPGEDDSYVDKLAARTPLQRMGGTEPVASAVVELLQNEFVTGEIVRLDGGAHLV